MGHYPERISVMEAYDRLKSDHGFLLDVRMPAEVRLMYAAGIDANIPLSELESRRSELPLDRPIYAICAGGSRSLTGALKLISLGFENVISIDGGTRAWSAAGLPTVINRSVLPLDQQFRLIVGVMILLFTLLGAYASRWFLAGSAFIGLMLSVTAILGVCPMMNVIKILPWNRTH